MHVQNNFYSTNEHWKPIEHTLPLKGTLSYYYSEPLSIIPIRDVSHKNDAKADPNFETLTYGLFTHCNKSMRKNIVTKGIQILFFCTSRYDSEQKRSVRVLTGYYSTGWFHEIKKNDCQIKAQKGKFVSPGFRLQDLIEYVDGYSIDRFFRTWKYLPHNVTNRLLKLLNTTPDATSEYISEIKKIEKITLEKNGSIYNNRTTGFSWEDAPSFMKPE